MNREERREYYKKYYQRPEVKERIRKYYQRPEVKERRGEYNKIRKGWWANLPSWKQIQILNKLSLKYLNEEEERE